MGFKIINSREYREVCERVAFLESDLDDKNRELELKEESIKRLKKEVVQLQDCLAKVKDDLRQSDELHGQARLEIAELRNQLAELKSPKPEVINFVPDEAKPIYEETVLQAEGESANSATVSKPRRGRKPRAKKDSK